MSADRKSAGASGLPAPQRYGFQLAGDAAQRYDTYVAPIMAPFVAALLDAASPAPGSAVLDVACGTGFTTRAAAAAVGPGGRVVGVDVNPGMLAAAAAHAPSAVRIQWDQAPADALPYTAAEFDTVLCQQGAQFFPDLPAAFAEAARVLRPGGRFALTAWASIDLSPFFLAQRLAIDEIAGPEVSAGYAAAFTCTGRRISAALHTAGFTEVRTREHTAHIRIPDLATFARNHITALPWHEDLRTAHPQGPEAAALAHAELLSPFTTSDGSADLPFTSTVAVATR